MDFLTRVPNSENEGLRSGPSGSGEDETHSGHVRGVKRRVIESSSENEGEEENNEEAEDEFEEGELVTNVSCKLPALKLHENHLPS